MNKLLIFLTALILLGGCAASQAPIGDCDDKATAPTWCGSENDGQGEEDRADPDGEGDGEAT